MEIALASPSVAPPLARTRGSEVEAEHSPLLLSTMEEAGSKQGYGEQNLAPMSPSTEAVQRRLSFSLDEMTQDTVSNHDSHWEMQQQKVAKDKDVENENKPNPAPGAGKQKDGVAQKESQRQKARLKQPSGKCLHGRRKKQFKSIMGIRRKNTAKS